MRGARLITLDLRELLVTGKLAGIPAGATTREVEAALGVPDAIAELGLATIWVYAGVEFTFVGEGALSGVFTDQLPLDGEDSRVTLRAWFLGSEEGRTLAAATRALDAAGVGWERKERDTRWSDPVPEGSRVAIGAWDGQRSGERVFADLELASGATLLVGCFVDDERATEDLIVAVGLAWPSA